MPRPIIEALLWDTLGFRHHNDPEFRKLYYKTDCTSGTYVNTFVVRGRHGCGLTRIEGKAVQQEIKRYLHGYRVVIDKNSTKDDIESAKMARKIDDAYETRSMDYYIGDRFWYNKNGKTSEIFCSKMMDRFQKTIDPFGNTEQEQSFIAVGCGTKLSQSISTYDAGSGLKGTCAPWGLLLSVLKVLNIKVEVISVPVVKTWTPTQFKKAEALITFLAGSLVTDGGCNPKQPGTSAGRPLGFKFEDERREIFIDRKILDENLEVAQQQMNERLKMVKWLWEVKNKTTGSDNMTFKELLDVATNPLIPAVKKLHADSKALADLMEERLAEVIDLRKQLEALDASPLQELKQYTRELREELEFLEAVDLWLNEDSDEEAPADEAAGTQPVTESQDSTADDSIADDGSPGPSSLATRLKITPS